MPETLPKPVCQYGARRTASVIASGISTRTRRTPRVCCIGVTRSRRRSLRRHCTSDSAKTNTTYGFRLSRDCSRSRLRVNSQRWLRSGSPSPSAATEKSCFLTFIKADSAPRPRIYDGLLFVRRVAIGMPSIMRKTPDGTTEWRNEAGDLHREDGPAVIYPHGRREWWRNGRRHRDDGPAIECCDGTKAWYRNGQLHRENGPAIEHLTGTKSWWLEGKKQREEY